MVVGELTIETELLVIGGGPGGHSAAFRAAELGVATTMVDDRPRLGGTWLHEGCVLSKELLHLADTVRAARDAARFGVEFGAPRFNVEQLRTSLLDSTEDTAAKLAERCAELKIEHVQGRARFESSRQVAIENNPAVPRIRFKRAIIASGSRDIPLLDAPPTGPRIMSPADALRMDGIPGTLLVIGASSVALELASVYAALGSRVTVVAKQARLLPHADADLVEVLSRQLVRSLERVHLDTVVDSLDDRGSAVGVTLHENGGPETAAVFDRVLIAIGRSPCVSGLDLERTDVQLDAGGAIKIDEQLRTTDPRIYAVGDAVGDPMLTLKATHQGRVAAEAIAGWGSAFDARAVPTVLFTDPQIAWCGLTEIEAKAREVEHRVQRVCWSAAGPSAWLRRSSGFTKIIYEPDTQLILGVGVVGANAAELIAEGALAIEMAAVLSDLSATIHPHPTSSEFTAAAAEQAEDESTPPWAEEIS